MNVHKLDERFLLGRQNASLMPSMGSLVVNPMAAIHQQQPQMKGAAAMAPSAAAAAAAANMQTPTGGALNNNKPNAMPFGTGPMSANLSMAGLLAMNSMTANGNGTNAGGLMDTKREPLLDGILGPMGGPGKGGLASMLPNFDDPVEQSLASLCKYGRPAPPSHPHP